MNNLKKLGLIFSVGTIAALSLVACSDDPATTTTTGGTSAGGSAAGTSAAGTSAAGTATGGGGSGSGGTASAGTASGGGGGTAAGGGGAGGTSAGGGGSGGGGAGGGGGGGAGGGGGTGGGGGAPSADCTKWCSGANGLIQQCAGKLPATVDSEQKCLAECNNDAAKGDKGLMCWNTHLAFIVGGQSKDTHCPHASGAPGNGQCNETK